MDNEGDGWWGVSSLSLLLNGSYYNAEDGTNSGYCIGFGTTITGNCDYTKKGIQSSYREMIANVTWYLGAHLREYETSEKFYQYERGTTVYGGSPTSTKGYIGLMYPSDYGFSVLASSCARTTYLSDYNQNSCSGQSWLYGQGFEWTIEAYGLTALTFSNDGNLNSTRRQSDGGVFRPVLYLDSSVYKIDGDGSLNSPYIIGM